MTGIDWRSWALIGALGVIWGGAFTSTTVAVASATPLSLAAVRLVLGALLLLALARFWGDGLPRSLREWRFVVIVALAANSIPFALLSWAQLHVESSLAGVLMASLPLMVLPMAHAFVPGDPMTWRKTLGFGVGFAGVTYLIGWDAFSQIGGAPVEILAQLACLAAAAGYATGSIATKLSPHRNPYSFGAAAISIAALLSTAMAFAFEDPLAISWTPEAAAAALYLGVFPTGVAMVILQIVIARRGPSFLSLVNYQVPLWALAFGVMFLGEEAPARAGLALCLILLGVAIAQGLRMRARPADPATTP